MNIAKLTSFILVLGFLLPGRSFAAPVEKNDAFFLDVGMFGIYKLSQDEIETLKDPFVQQFYETYVRRYFAAYMYLTKNIVSVEVHQGYSPKIVDPIINSFNNLTPEKRKEKLMRMYLQKDGVELENKELFSKVKPLVEAWDKEKGYPVVDVTAPDFSPENIRKVYLQRVGLVARQYQDQPQNSVNEKNDVLLMAQGLGLKEQIIGGFLLLVFGIIVGAKFPRRNRAA